ncbi:MAG: hypothetical protein ACHQSE_03025 [Gemmatimonadales bacterium]
MTSLAPLLLAFSLLQNPDSVVARAKEAIRPLTDSVALHNAGFLPLQFGPVRDLTPFQGQHWLSIGRVLTMAMRGDTAVDIDAPSFVMYLPMNGTLKPVGVAYTERIASRAAAPTTFAGMPAMWHTHMFCRNVPGEGQVLADGLEDCTDRDGRPTRNQIAMIHTWTIPNPDGPFAHDNPSLPFIAVGLKPPAHPTRDDRLFGIALGETYGALLPEGHRIDHEARAAGTLEVLEAQRKVLRDLVPQLVAAEKSGDQAKFDQLRTKSISTYETLLSAYRGLASTPQIKSRMDVELAEMVGDAEMKMPK